MKTLVPALAILFTPVAAKARPMTDSNVAQRLRQLEDRVALKQLVDTLSTLADREDIASQMRLFTEDAVVESYSGGRLISSLKGRAEIGSRFGAFLAGFDTVYHINGQQTVELKGDTAPEPLAASSS